MALAPRGVVAIAQAGQPLQHDLGRAATAAGGERHRAGDGAARILAAVARLDQGEQELSRPLPAVPAQAVEEQVGAAGERAAEAAELPVDAGAQDVAVALVPEQAEQVADQRQGARLGRRFGHDVVGSDASLQCRPARRAGVWTTSLRPASPIGSSG